ncbi:MAG: hypothetical protein ABJB74_15300 [Gemmatimonas sp.]
MLRLDLLCGLAFALTVAGCNDSAITAPVVRQVRYSGTISQPAPGGFLVYKLSGSWTLNDKGELLSGSDTTDIIDGKVYGMAGTVRLVLKTVCIGIQGKEAWAESEIVTSSEPQAFPVGGRGVTHISLVSGAPKGGGGPKELWYPTGSVCADKPTTMNLFDMVGGSIVFP